MRGASEGGNRGQSPVRPFVISTEGRNLIPACEPRYEKPERGVDGDLSLRSR